MDPFSQFFTEAQRHKEEIQQRFPGDHTTLNTFFDWFLEEYRSRFIWPPSPPPNPPEQSTMVNIRQVNMQANQLTGGFSGQVVNQTHIQIPPQMSLKGLTFIPMRPVGQPLFVRPAPMVKQEMEKPFLPHLPSLSRPTPIISSGLINHQSRPQSAIFEPIVFQPQVNKTMTQDCPFTVNQPTEQPILTSTPKPFAHQEESIFTSQIGLEIFDCPINLNKKRKLRGENSQKFRQSSTISDSVEVIDYCDDFCTCNVRPPRGPSIISSDNESITCLDNLETILSSPKPIAHSLNFPSTSTLLPPLPSNQTNLIQSTTVEYQTSSVLIKPRPKYRCKWVNCLMVSAYRQSIAKHVRRVHFKVPITLIKQNETGNKEPINAYEFVERAN